jgi:hypothetical protein
MNKPYVIDEVYVIDAPGITKSFAEMMALEKNRKKDVTPQNRDVWICKEDLEHHTRFFGAGSFEDGRTTPTPIEAFELTAQFGVVPHNYLDRFTENSHWHQEIQAYKKSHNMI